MNFPLLSMVSLQPPSLRLTPMKKIEIEGCRWRFWLAPGASVEERAQAAHAICRFLIDAPRSQAELRRAAVRTALAQYQGALRRRAMTLEREYRRYLACGWPHEQDMESLPEPRSTERVLLHRLARCNGGRSLCWRRIFEISSSPQD
jgi:hypothetical protein